MKSVKRKCSRCGNTGLHEKKRPATRTIAGHSFKASVPALVCDSCGAIYFNGPALENFDLAVANKVRRFHFDDACGTSPEISTGTPCLHARSQGAAALQVARSNGTRIGPPGDLRFRAGLLDHEIPGAALRPAKERDGPFDRPRNQIARAEVEAVFRLGKQRLPAARATDVNQLLPSKLIGAVFNRARIAVSARVGVEQAAIDLQGAIEREGQLLPGMMDAAGDGPLPRS